MSGTWILLLLTFCYSDKNIISCCQCFIKIILRKSTGNTCAWEQRKLGDLVQFSKGTGYSKGDLRESGTPIILYGRLYTKYETVISEVDTFADAKAGSVYSRGGEVIVPASGETAEDISIASVVEKSGVLLGGDLNIITPPADLDAPFLAISISNGKPHEDMAKMAQGKSVVHLHNTDLEKIDLTYPSHEEQIQISGYFGALDHLITLHQREESCAASFSASCFGTLKAFFWEQRKLSDLAEIVGGGTPDTNNSAYWDGDIDWYAPAEMEGQRYAKGSVRKITELGLQKSSAKILPAHRTVLFTSRAGIGKMAILQRPAATNQGFQSLVLKDGTDPYFIYSMGERIKGMAEGVASGSTFLEISGKMLGNLEVMVPNLKEQESIATFFRGIDDLITLHQCKPKSRKGGSHVLYSYQV